MSFDEDAVGSLQTGSSAINMSSSAEEDCERRGQVAPRNTRIGRPSPVLKRVRGSSPFSNPSDSEQISYQMMTYPLVYMLIWTIPTTIRIYQATTGKSAPFAIGTIDKVYCLLSSISTVADRLVLYRYPGFCRRTSLWLQRKHVVAVAWSLQEAEFKQ
jgi:hypothetical protein